MQSGDWPLIFVLHAETYSLRTVMTNDVMSSAGQSAKTVCRSLVPML